MIPSELATSQSSLLLARVLIGLECSHHFGIFGREVDPANREQPHPDAILWGIDSSLSVFVELCMILCVCILVLRQHLISHQLPTSLFFALTGELCCRMDGAQAAGAET